MEAIFLYGIIAIVLAGLQYVVPRKNRESKEAIMIRLALLIGALIFMILMIVNLKNAV